MAEAGSVCGRYVTVQTPESLAEAFAASLSEHAAAVAAPNYNVAPTDSVPAIRIREAHRELTAARWGFLPRWAKELKSRPQPINARSDKLLGRMYAPAMLRHRMLLPATGFYEWEKLEDGSKQPYFVHSADGEILTFAAIGSWWSDPGAQDPPPVLTVAIVTTDAGDQMRRIHARQPVLLANDDERAAWLDTEGLRPPDVLDLVASDDDVPLVLRAVSTRVNNVRNQGPELLEPLDA